MAAAIIPWIAQNAARNQQQARGGPPALNQNLIGSALGRYQRNRAANAGQLAGQGGTAVQAPGAPGVGVGQDLPLGMSQAMMGGPSGDAPDAMGAEPDGAANGTIVTRPTIVKLAEKGIPEAVVPLNPNAGSHVRPDLLEGEIKPPQLPGMRYRQYKGFSKLSY